MPNRARCNCISLPINDPFLNLLASNRVASPSTKAVLPRLQLVRAISMSLAVRSSVSRYLGMSASRAPVAGTNRWRSASAGVCLPANHLAKRSALRECRITLNPLRFLCPTATRTRKPPEASCRHPERPFRRFFETYETSRTCAFVCPCADGCLFRRRWTLPSVDDSQLLTTGDSNADACRSPGVREKAKSDSDGGVRWWLSRRARATRGLR